MKKKEKFALFQISQLFNFNFSKKIKISTTKLSLTASLSLLLLALFALLLPNSDLLASTSINIPILSMHTLGIQFITRAYIKPSSKRLLFTTYTLPDTKLISIVYTYPLDIKHISVTYIRPASHI